MHTRLSVNINKVALLRNSRGGNIPDVIKFAIDCEKFGAEGITVHPRPDERHIKKTDALQLANVVTTEYNIEGFPDQRYLEIIEKARPTQATLVPDPPNAITSNQGWNIIENYKFLQKIITQIKNWGIRVSIFVETDIDQIKAAKDVGADRIELYTGPYAHEYPNDKYKAIKPYIKAAEEAQKIGLEINAGHDLNLQNLRFLKQNIPYLKEVSIGHALIADALYLGIKETIKQYKLRLKLDDQNT